MAREHTSAEPRLAWLAMIAILTFAAGILPSSGLAVYTWRAIGGEAALSLDLFAYLTLLAIGLMLALSTPRQSGLILGELKPHWRGVLVVCAAPLLLVLLDDSPPSDNPFSAQSYTMWLISPIAQDLIFIGFIYGQLERLWPGVLHPRVRISRALAMTSLAFALFHLPNLAQGLSPDFMIFQLIYTGVGLLIVGLSRQWTGSILYATSTHTLVNLYAWLTG